MSSFVTNIAMASPHDPQAFRFLDFPGELRNQVYRELLTTKAVKKVWPCGHHTYKFHMAVLRTNHQIFEEAMAIFETNVFIHIETMSSGLVDMMRYACFHFIQIGEKADIGVSDSYLSVDIFCLQERCEDTSFHFITCLEDLPEMCQILVYEGLGIPGFNEQLTLEVQLCNWNDAFDPVSESLQRSLLMPFARLKDLNELQLHGPWNKTILKDFRKALKTREPTMEEKLYGAISLKDDGNDALKACNYELAIQKYLEAFEITHTTVTDYSLIVRVESHFDQILSNGKHGGENGAYVRYLLYFRLTSNIILTYTKLGEYQKAIHWGNSQVEEMKRDSLREDPRDHLVQPKDEAKFWYRLALACKGAFKYNQALRALHTAMQQLPGDRLIGRAVRNVMIEGNFYCTCGPKAVLDEMCPFLFKMLVECGGVEGSCQCSRCR
ncbi:MAG: hypothetical protein M1834_006814 [Cirrosporium novae-zelandiae]|nr:MAG: hypothetical protein M1834_006814 [Cirrosporium novae-zelandiae]